MASTDEQGTSYEAEHVHSVYEQIASHFSSTRYKVYITYPNISLRKAR
jgi:tRNA (uracil-5-)-methyltransferase TRM9